jgi:hypothetical protein
MEMDQLVCGLEQKETLDQVLLSNDVKLSRTAEISFNILESIMKELAATLFL